MTPHHRTLAAVVGAMALSSILLNPATADAQRAVPRGGAPQAHRAVPRPIPARPIYRGGVYRGPTVYRRYYASPPYWYGGFYGGYYAYPFSFSVGVGYPYYYSYPYYTYYPYPYYGYPYGPSASLRLQATPKEAQVFVDGHYAGTVDDFNGAFQRLNVSSGEHTLEIYMPGYRSVVQKLYLQPGKTFNVKLAMEPLAPGEPEPLRPTEALTAPPPPQRSQGRQTVAPPDRDFEGQPPSRSDFGSLALRVQPGEAAVVVDGDTWQASDNERLIIQVGPGVHTVEIHKDGYRTYITDVTVRPGETATLNVALSPNR